MCKKYLIVIIFCLLCSVTQAQQSLFEEFNLPLYDCEQKALREAKKITVVVPNDSTIVWSKAKNYKENGARRGAEINIITESKLQRSDLDGNLFIIGPIADYSNWDRFGIPVEKFSNGFKLGNFYFNGTLYGFTYAALSETFPLRVVISGNSLDAYIHTANDPSFGFEYVVVNNAVPELIGNGSHIVDMNALRESIYMLRESKYYAFMISKNLDDKEIEKINDVEIERYDNHVEAFVNKMELNLPDKKIKTYIHATQEEIKFFSGWFDTLCDEGTVWGNVMGDEIHSWKMGGAIEHEVNHHLFNQQVNKMAATFLSEGIQKWYEFTISAEAKERGFQKAREFADEDLTDVVCGMAYFFQGDKYYLISGIFTGYLIDTYGLDKFKALYKYETHEILSGFENTYDKPLSKILEEYKNWLFTKATSEDMNQ